MKWTFFDPRMTIDHLGLIPIIFDERDPRPAREQANDRYSHGGGWRPFNGFRVMPRALHYSGDPPIRLLAETQLRDETIRLYEHSWVGIFQADGSHEISRMD